MVLDYTWERREELIRAEEYEDGRQDGAFSILMKLVVSGVITVEQAAAEAGMDVATFEKRMKEAR